LVCRHIQFLCESSHVDGIIAQKAALNTQLDLIEIELADQQKLLDRGLAQA